MWRMQGGYGRVVWLPTFDADNHVKHFKDAPEGIKVVGADGKALPALREVAKICAQQKLVLCTGHASPPEVLAIVEAARDAGCDRIVDGASTSGVRRYIGWGSGGPTQLYAVGRPADEGGAAR